MKIPDLFVLIVRELFRISLSCNKWL